MSEDAPTRADVLAAVERSPDALLARDRDGWLAVFGPQAQIEDPVGSRPHRGPDEIARFYDTFIGPRDIVFHGDADVVVGSTVIRDVVLEVTMGSRLTMRIPTFIRYDVDHDGNVTALRAVWELRAMVLQFARGGVAAIPAGAALSRNLLRNQGLGGAVGFLSGFRGVGRGGRRRVADLLDAACAGDEVSARGRLGDHVTITLGDGDRLSTSELVAQLAGGHPSKILVAGNTVAARVDRDGRRSVVFAEMTPTPLAISRIRFYAEDE
jgi:hypothetical protein